MLHLQRVQSPESLEESRGKGPVHIGQAFSQKVEHEKHIRRQLSRRHPGNGKGRHGQDGQGNACRHKYGQKASPCIVFHVKPQNPLVGFLPLSKEFGLGMVNAHFLSGPGIPGFRAVIIGPGPQGFVPQRVHHKT